VEFELTVGEDEEDMVIQQPELAKNIVDISFPRHPQRSKAKKSKKKKPRKGAKRSLQRQSSLKPQIISRGPIEQESFKENQPIVAQQQSQDESLATIEVKRKLSFRDADVIGK